MSSDITESALEACIERFFTGNEIAQFQTFLSALKIEIGVAEVAQPLTKASIKTHRSLIKWYTHRDSNPKPPDP